MGRGRRRWPLRKYPGTAFPWTRLVWLQCIVSRVPNLWHRQVPLVYILSPGDIHPVDVRSFLFCLPPPPPPPHTPHPIMASVGNAGDDQLSDEHRRGLMALAAGACISLTCTAFLFFFLTFKLGQSGLDQRRRRRHPVSQPKPPIHLVP